VVKAEQFVKELDECNELAPRGPRERHAVQRHSAADLGGESPSGVNCPVGPVVIAGNSPG
jgi:hypothetical protein